MHLRHVTLLLFKSIARAVTMRAEHLASLQMQQSHIKTGWPVLEVCKDDASSLHK
jgi:hypothetical protein